VKLQTKKKRDDADGVIASPDRDWRFTRSQRTKHTTWSMIRAAPRRRAATLEPERIKWLLPESLLPRVTHDLPLLINETWGR